MIAIVDYGVGNPGSILNMFRRLGIESAITSDARDIAAASKIVLPGVGAFDHAVTEMSRRGIDAVLHDRVLGARVPILGICLGMQLMSRGSDEGSSPGLGWIDAHTARFAFAADAPGFRAPHMGWNTVSLRRPNPLLGPEVGESRYYFVHSYHVHCRDSNDVIGTTSYGIEFTAAIRRGNIFGTQFHPEKSHRFGLAILRRFGELPL
jgi:imidazole glycerol-phosphate synthase subunit HisH